GFTGAEADGRPPRFLLREACRAGPTGPVGLIGPMGPVSPVSPGSPVPPPSKSEWMPIPMVVRRMEMCAQLCSRRFVIPGLKITSALAVAGVLLAGSWPAGAEVTASLPGSVLSDTTHPLSALSEDLPDAEWMRQAAEIARRVAAEPLVELTPQPATEGEIAYRLRLNRPTRDPVLRLALAVPPEGVTSAGLTLDGPPAG